MKMDLDCIRDILLEAETFPRGPFPVESLTLSTEKYGAESVEYNALKLIEAGFLRGIIDTDLSGIPCVVVITDIAFPGHDFLNKIRDKKNWTAIQSGLHAVRSYSLDAISAVASGIATAAISAYVEKASSTLTKL